ncbi:MAG: T9SS type A sorting domain-containing protein [Saprospiraceae bacterium]|nr:T9SS type A sorting domain-containing protein [Saprospiraceae bacterium]
MKLSIQLIGLLFGVLFFNPLEAKNNLPENTPDNTCEPPGLPVVSNVTSISARITWTKPAGGVGITYEYEIGPAGFTPGNGVIVSLSDTTVLLTNLAANTALDVYVRSICGEPMPSASDWIGPVNFHTAAGCGDQITDPGGASGDYGNGEKTTEVICPDIPGTVVTLDITDFNLADGDSLYVFNGTSLGVTILATYFDISIPPLSVTSSDPSGCLTVQFVSDGEKIAEGYIADIVCEVPEVCFPVEEVNVFNLTSTSANFSWPAVFGAIGYEWELVNGFTGVTVGTNIVLGTSVQIPNLLEANLYTFRVRTICDLPTESNWFSAPFYTPINCSNKPLLACGPTTTSGPISATGPGIWQTNACGNTTPTPGKERIFRFIAPHTRMYTFQAINGNSPGNSYVTYAYKEASQGCGPFDWNCIGSFLVSVSGISTTFGPLVAGKEYLILFDAETTTFVQHSFRIKDCDPPNDEARNAVTLELDHPCTGNIYSNAQATFNFIDSLGQEPNPDVMVDDMDELSGRWLTAADQTVWFKFVSPLSGSVIISTESLPQGQNFDTQLALYETTDSSKYKIFRLIASDDDNGQQGLGYNSEFCYSGLTPGQTYYIQVDGYGSIISGTFCIEVKEGVIRLNEAECTPGYFVENVDGTAPDGDHWYDVYSRPDDLDLGDLLIAVKPGLQNLDTVFCRASVADTIPVATNHVPYMPVYYRISSSNPPSEPYTVRLFYHRSEFDSLVVKSGLEPGEAIPSNLVATHYSGPNEDCFQQNNSYEDPGPGTGTPTLITDIKAVSMGSSNMFYVEFQIPGDGEIGVHLQQTVLPLELGSFTGEIADAHNRIKWVTETEKNVASHILERSADGVHWSEIYRVAGQVNSTAPTHYAYDDRQPLPKSFYRLRSVDFDGQMVLSSIVVLTRQLFLELDKVFPSPTSDRIHLNFSTPEETDLLIRVTDVTGQQVIEQQISAQKGRQSTTLSLQTLPAGVYLLTMSDGNNALAPVRIVKQ